jgi:hypothetical protein
LWQYEQALIVAAGFLFAQWCRVVGWVCAVSLLCSYAYCHLVSLLVVNCFNHVKTVVWMTCSVLVDDYVDVSIFIDSRTSSVEEI